MKKILSISISLLVSITILAQKPKAPVAKKPVPAIAVAPVAKPNPVVFTFAKDTVYKTEFERLLNKNRKEKDTPTEKDVREYLDLYINFKLKVKEALNWQLDTNPSFKTELAGYRKQLANPYLSDKKVSEGLVNEAYERMKIEVNASHILINCAENASAADTLAAYNKLLDIKKRIAKGESFDSLAAKNSDDPSAKKNFGKLGWFSTFQMIYPFENMAYKNAKGEISMPFRTQFGYHIIRVNDKRAARGDVKVAHIMIRTGPNSNLTDADDAKAKIDSAYTLLQKGESFESAVEKYSQDDGSKGNKGVMNWIPSLSGYPEEFKDMCFNLKENETTKPFRTDYGWHIVKFLERKPLGDFKELQDMIKNKVTRDSRSESTKSAVVARIKKENKYTENKANLKEFTAMLDSNFLKGTWTFDENKPMAKPVFGIGDKTYTQGDFANFVKANQQPSEKGSKDMLALNLFNKWVDDKCIAYEENMLEAKYEEFRNILQEYHDGILLFDLTDRKVWSRAVTDTTGLEKFYEQNKGKYMWKERVEYYTFNCLDEKAKTEAMKMAAAGKKFDDIVKKLNKKVTGTVTIRQAKAEKSDAVGEKLWDKKAVVDIPNEASSFKFYYVQGIVQPETKTLKEAKGIATSDYQNYLEKEWIAELRAKYPVWINEETVKALYK